MGGMSNINPIYIIIMFLIYIALRFSHYIDSL